MVRVYLSPHHKVVLEGNGLVFLVDSPLCSLHLIQMLCTWGICSEHVWLRDPWHEHHLEPMRDAKSKTLPSLRESESAI